MRAPANRCVFQEDIVLSERFDAATDAAPSAGPTAEQSETGREAPAQTGLVDLIVTSLEDDKAEDIVSIPLAGKSEIADHLVIASGRSTRQVAAISEKLTERVKQQAGVIPKVEGLDSADWVLIDCGDAIVHVFRPEVRDFYQLEKMWLPANEAAKYLGSSATAPATA